MRMIKLTNRSPNREGDAIWINADHITAVYEDSVQGGGSLTTRVYGGPTGLEWVVEESAGEVLKLIKGVDNTAD